jgi:hypothetical protein
VTDDQAQSSGPSGGVPRTGEPDGGYRQDLSAGHQGGHRVVRHLLHLAVFTFSGSLFVLLAASFLPIWIVWYFNEWEGVGEKMSFWALRVEVSTSTPQVRHVGDRSNINTAIIVAALGGLFGGLVWLASTCLSRRRRCAGSPQDPTARQ